MASKIKHSHHLWYDTNDNDDCIIHVTECTDNNTHHINKEEDKEGYDENDDDDDNDEDDDKEDDEEDDDNQIDMNAIFLQSLIAYNPTGPLSIEAIKDDQVNLMASYIKLQETIDLK